MNKTKIDWCDSTWNPVTGCLHGCEYCYARGIAHRFGFHASEPDIHERVLYECPVSAGKKVPYPFDFQPTFHKYRLNEYADKQGRNIFVCSMADLFGEWVPEEWIEKVFEACRAAPQHNYLFLTKNPVRYKELHEKELLPESKNMWYGMTATNATQAYTAEVIRWHIPSGARTFLSIEPILTPIIHLPIVDWIIIGAETGNRKDRVVPKREWIENIVGDCRYRKVPIFMKSSIADIRGELLIQEFPEELKRKE